MRLRASAVFAAVVLLSVAATTSWADLSAYNQDFEGLIQSDPNALGNDGWLYFANVFNGTTGLWMYGYGPGPAPNGGAAFSAIASGEGGPQQGAQQLSVYSDYNNGDHGNGHIIEANVFQEQVVGAGDVDKTFVFEFDAKLGNLELNSTAAAFIKTLDPAAGYAMTNFITEDMTTTPITWSTYSISIDIDAGLVGQILQFGFMNTATNYEGSGIFYDNVNFDVGGPVSVQSDSWAAVKALYR
jgi:hypothetical protein